MLWSVLHYSVSVARLFDGGEKVHHWDKASIEAIGKSILYRFARGNVVHSAAALLLALDDSQSRMCQRNQHW